MQGLNISKAVWEITNACNMRCKHCGSSCGDPLANELSSDLALSLCDQLAAFGITGISLSGGEPFIRKDWYDIVCRLTNHNIATNMITNGWLIDEKIVNKLIQSRIDSICISIDGDKRAHNLLRKPGAFQKVVEALELLNRHQVPISCITTINQKNFKSLPQIKNLLLQHGIKRWQMQLAMPMGNIKDRLDFILAVKDIPNVIKFCHQVMQEGKIIVHLGDNIGYYSEHGEENIRAGGTTNNKDKNFSFAWQGCHAGKRIIGIRADGWITGCLAIRNPKYFAGNIKDKSLADICNHPDAFALHRKMQQKDLQGFCRECKHGDICLGGCNAQKEAFCQSIYAENPTCLFRSSKL